MHQTCLGICSLHQQSFAKTCLFRNYGFQCVLCPFLQHALTNSSGRIAPLTATALRTTRAVRSTASVPPVDVTLSMEDPDVKSVSEMFSSRVQRYGNCCINRFVFLNFLLMCMPTAVHLSAKSNQDKSQNLYKNIKMIKAIAN